MTRSIAELADLRALEMGTFSIVRQPTDLRSLVEDVAHGFAPADRKRIAIDCESSPVAWIDAGRVTRVLARLVQLALTTSWQGARVAIRIHVEEDRAIVSVMAPGTLAASVVRLALQSLDSRGGWDGHELGIYVARATVESHGGRLVIAELPAAARSQLAVELPTA